MTTKMTPRPPGPPLDPSLYSLSGEELEFFKTQTGIHDEEELKNHIIAIQTKAYAVCHSHLFMHRIRDLKHRLGLSIPMHHEIRIFNVSW
jgi:hypothetical protein